MASKVAIQGLLSCIIIACLLALVQSRSLPSKEETSAEPQDESQSRVVSVQRRATVRRKKNTIQLSRSGFMALNLTDNDSKITGIQQSSPNKAVTNTYVQFTSPSFPLHNKSHGDSYNYLDVDVARVKGQTIKLVVERDDDSLIKILAFVEDEGKGTILDANQDEPIVGTQR